MIEELSKVLTTVSKNLAERKILNESRRSISSFFNSSKYAAKLTETFRNNLKKDEQRRKEVFKKTIACKTQIITYF